MSTADNAPARRRVPGPVLAAVAVFAVVAVLALIAGTAEALAGEPLAVLTLAIAAVEGLVAFGVWRGNRVAYVVTIVFAALTIPSTLFPTHNLDTAGAIVADLMQIGFATGLLFLLLAPASARAYFARRGAARL